MKLRLAALAMLLVLPWGGAAAAPGDDVLDADARYRAALSRGDVAALADVLDENVRVVHGGGLLQTGRDAFIEGARSWRFTRYERSDVTVRIDGALAVMTARTEKLRTDRAMREDDFSVVVFARRDGIWRIVQLQNTPARP